MYPETDSECLMLSKVNEPFNYRKYAAVDPHFGCVFSAFLPFPEKLPERGETEPVPGRASVFFWQKKIKKVFRYLRRGE